MSNSEKVQETFAQEALELSEKWTVSARSHQSISALCRLAESALANVFHVELKDIRAASRCQHRIARARQTAAYLSHVGFGLSLTAVGRSFGRDRTTIRHACALIEDARDDTRTDMAVALLEQALTVFRTMIESVSSERSSETYEPVLGMPA